jgi:hypothetical protein
MSKRKAQRPNHPVYGRTSGQGAVIRLEYPFRIGSRWIRSVQILPPTLRELERLRGRDDLRAADVLAPMTGFDQDVIRFFRWPDVETALMAALDLLPPDFAALLRGEQSSSAQAPSEGQGQDTGPNDLADFLRSSDEF